MQKGSCLQAKESSRHLGIEAMRIVATFMVIILHTLGSTDILSRNAANGKGMVLWLFEILSYGAVNCFALTSGYVSCKSKFKISRILYLWFQVMFIFVVMTVALGFVSPSDVKSEAYINMFFPIIKNLNWYFTAFFGLFFFAPFLNILMQNLTKRQHMFLMAAIFILLSVVPTVPFAGDLFMVNGGYSLFWLMSMYIIGGYIRIHGMPDHNKRFKWLGGFFASSLFVWIWYLGVQFATEKLFGAARYHRMLLSYTSPFILLAAICLLEFFLAVNIKRGGKAICTISSVTFGVFIFHTQDLYWIFGLENPMNAVADKSIPVVALSVVAVALTAFVLCGFATWLQMKLFRIVGINKLCDFVQAKINKKFARASESKE